MRIIRKTLVIGCIVAAFSCILLLLGLSQYYYSSRPREPHPELGRIYVERVKGASGVADVYLTRIEHLPFDYAIYIQSASMLFALVAFLLNQRWKVIHTPSYTPQKKFY
jgi:hypothetical protein